MNAFRRGAQHEGGSYGPTSTSTKNFYLYVWRSTGMSTSGWMLGNGWPPRNLGGLASSIQKGRQPSLPCCGIWLKHPVGRTCSESSMTSHKAACMRYSQGGGKLQIATYSPLGMAQNSGKALTDLCRFCKLLKQQQQMETIDQVKTEGMLYAKKKCRKLAMGEVEWSPEIAVAQQWKLLWQKIVWKKCGGRVSSTHIQWKAQQCSVVCPLSCTLDQAIWAKHQEI